MIPRWIHHLRADMLGYFWLPCPVCGRDFGGHEIARRRDPHAALMTSPSRGLTVCNRCVGSPDVLASEDYWFPKTPIVLDESDDA